MLALGLQTLLLMSAAYCLGAALACGVRRLFFSSAARAPIEVGRHVEPLPQLDADVVGMRRFVPAGAPAAIAPEPQTAPLTSPRQTAAAGEPSAPQDLKRIETIDAATEAALNQLGINRYDQISQWRRADVERIAQALAIKRQRISRENWIEQAQMLATGAQTHFAQRRARGETARAAPSADQGERRQLRAAHPAAPPRAAATGPSPPLSAGAVVARPQAPVAPPGAALTRGPAPSAAPPAVSQRAAFARAPAPGAGPPAPVRRSAVAELAPSLRAGAAPVVGKPVPGLVEPARPIRPLPLSEVDNLQRIRGIDAELARRLVTAGIQRYEEIAAWSAADVERFDRDLAGAGRIARENWIEQAQILMKGGATAFSRAFDRGSPAAPTPPPEAPAAAAEGTAAGEPERAPPARSVLLGALRSVRSQAYQNPEPGPEAAYRVGSHNRVVRSGLPQDLKRIRGIGVLIEKRLNAMQIATYEQIANWTAQDIERVSRVLDFKGRIERENWVEQARILASGGATEFSRRVDRGDVETGRYRP
jgi:predicted flap endonuclease-1-like 5' DNA nuclease